MKADEILEIKRDVETIREFINGGYEKYLKEHSECDKHNRGFNKDSRFPATVERHYMSFDSWKGDWGNSNCYTWLSIHDGKLFWKCFDEYINAHLLQVMNGVADLMAEEAKKNVDELIKERDNLSEKIKEIGEL